MTVTGIKSKFRGGEKTPDEYLPAGRESRSGARRVSASQWPYGHGEGTPKQAKGGPTLNSEARLSARETSSLPTALWLPYGYIPRRCWPDVITYRAAVRGVLSSSLYTAVKGAVRGSEDGGCENFSCARRLIQCGSQGGGRKHGAWCGACAVRRGGRPVVVGCWCVWLVLVLCGAE